MTWNSPYGLIIYRYGFVSIGFIFSIHFSIKMIKYWRFVNCVISFFSHFRTQNSTTYFLKQAPNNEFIANKW